MPARIIVCFVEVERKNGHYSKNPYYFKRKWTVPVKPSGKELEKLPQSEEGTSSRYFLLEQRLEETLAMNQELLARLEESSSTSSKKGKGPARPKIRPRQGQQSRETEHFVEFLEQDNLSLTSGSTVTQDQPPAPVQPITKEVFVKKVELLLNGVPLDQLEDDQGLII